MKVDRLDDNIIVFLNKYYIKDLDYDDIKVIEQELKPLFKKLEGHHIKIKGYYDVFIYKDTNYGIIIELTSNNLGYEDFNEVIDMRILTKNVKFLYKVDDIIPLDIKYDLYLYKKDLYLDILEDINDKSMAYLIENSKIIYKDMDIIKKCGRVLKEYML